MDRPTALLLLLTAGALILYIVRRTNRTFPPGPKGLPLLGNIFDIPQDKPWLTYQQWSHEYNSEIIHCNLAGNHVFILNSHRVVFDLLEKRSSIYSDRQRLTVLNKLLNAERIFSLAPYGNEWRDHRRMFHRFFHATAAMQFQPQISKNVRKLICRLLTMPEPKDVTAQLHLMTGATILDVVYGFNVESENDPHIITAEKASRAITGAQVNGTYAVESFPILRYFPSWFPGAGFQKHVAVWKRDINEMLELPFAIVKASLRENNAVHPSSSIIMSLLDDLSAEGDPDGQKEILVKEVTAMAYDAGSDTLSFTLVSFVLAMLLYPDIQHKVQEELDRVIGRSRLPTISDRDSLPFTTASVIELLRWRPLTPTVTATAIPHRLMADDIYEGYHLPKGSMIIANAWAILHDERTYKDPSVFDPERFLTKEGRLKKDAKVTSSAGFGFGRRICPGRHFAELSLWTSIASLLWSFDIVKALDEDGNIMEPSGEFTSTLLSHPVPFRCRFNPRSHSVGEIVRAAGLVEDWTCN